LRGKLVHFPLNPLLSLRDPLVTKSALSVWFQIGANSRTIITMRMEQKR
jgi:hypothetical protein